MMNEPRNKKNVNSETYIIKQGLIFKKFLKLWVLLVSPIIIHFMFLVEKMLIQIIHLKFYLIVSLGINENISIVSLLKVLIVKEELFHMVCWYFEMKKKEVWTKHWYLMENKLWFMEMPMLKVLCVIIHHHKNQWLW